jgi:RNA polymerase, sigma 28 subunit, SigD/FliA/WhiG
MREISEILGVSLSRVSQLHGKALLKIKNLLEKEIKDI